MFIVFMYLLYQVKSHKIFNDEAYFSLFCFQKDMNDDWLRGTKGV